MRRLLIVIVATVLLSAAIWATKPLSQPVQTPITGEAVFVAEATFADGHACAMWLGTLVRGSPKPTWDGAVGPYLIAPNDTRAHRVRARDWGHEIEEWRCLGAALSVRRWTHSLSEVKPFTVEDIGKMSFPDR